MPEINQLSYASQLSDNDQVPVYSTDNSGTRRVSVADLRGPDQRPVFNQKNVLMVYPTKVSTIGAKFYDGQEVEIDADETKDGRRTRYTSLKNVLTFKDYADAKPQTDAALLVYSTLAEAQAAAATLPDGQLVISPNTGGRSVLHTIFANSLMAGKDINFFATPEEFGAKGDFSQDDYPAFQKALDYLFSVGGGLLVSKGKYSISRQLRTRDNVTIDMSGTGYIRRDFLTGVNGSGVISVNWGGSPSNNITIKNGTIDGNGQNYFGGHNGFGCVDTKNLLIENVVFLNNVSAHAIDIAKVDGARIINCKFLGYADADGTRGFSEAIQLDPGGASGGKSRNIVIKDCYCGPNPASTDSRFGAWPTFVGNHSVNVAASIVDGVVIANNFMDGCTWAHISPYAWDNVSIIDNLFQGGDRGVYMQQGTGTKTQGCVGVTIKGNKFIDVKVNAVFLNGFPSNPAMHKNVIIEGNYFRNSGVGAVLRCAQADGVVFATNIVEGYAQVVVTTTGCIQKDFSISDNIIKNVQGQIIGLLGADSEISITNNNVDNFTGRFVHSNGVGDAAARGRILITGNNLTDCSGSVFIAADSGATANFVVKGNSFSVGKLNMQPSTDELIRITTSGRSEVTDNYVSDSLIAKKVNVANGIFSGRFAGSPEGILTCGAGSVVFNSNGGAGATMFVKESISGNTGWVAK